MVGHLISILITGVSCLFLYIRVLQGIGGMYVTQPYRISVREIPLSITPRPWFYHVNLDIRKLHFIGTT